MPPLPGSDATRPRGADVGPATLEPPPNEAVARGATTAVADGPARAESFVFPTSFAQRRLWFLDQLEPRSSVYNVPQAFRLAGDLRVESLERSLREIVRRHESLRTTFGVRDGEPVQIIAPSLALDVPLRDLSALSAPDREREARRLMREEAARPFDLATGPLVRALLVRLDARAHVLVLVLHHIIAEGGWSMRVLLGELGALYDADLAGRPSPLDELPIQYADYAVWQREAVRGEVVSRQLDYWRARLAGAPTMFELPTDRPRPAVAGHRGDRQSRAAPVSLVRALRALAAAEHTTLPLMLLAAWGALLSRYGGQDDLVIGLPIAGRARPEVEGLIGFFVNTLVLRLDLSGDPTGREILRRVRDVAVGAFANQDLPFERLVEAVHPRRALSHMPLVQVTFAPQRAPRQPLSLTGLGVSPIDVHAGTATFDLTLFAHETEDADDLQLTIEYRTELYDASTIQRAMDHLLRALEGLATDPEQRLSRLPLMGAEEHQRVVVEWNDTASADPLDDSLTARFEACVRETPLACALVRGATTLTYAELDRRANVLARRLRAAGVRREQLVGLAIERSVEMIVAMLAILKAGGAYVPLDPTYPADRLAFMIADARLSVLLVHEATRGRFAAFDGVIVRVDAEGDDAPPDARNVYAFSAMRRADDLAYVMYTSGSTGRPNGVEITHRGVLRLVTDVDYVPLDGARRLLQLAPSSFDASTFEIWGALLHGARCVLAPNEPPSAVLLRSLIDRHGVDVLWLTASLFNAVVDDDVTALRGVRWLLIGGEALSVSHVRRALDALPEMEIINGYGPTEATTFTCCARIERPLDPRAMSIPIGRPIANTRVYVLDRHRQPVPVGVPGELYIGGAGLARGYLRRPELTAEKFVEAPWHPGSGNRLYRSGDVVRWRPDGMLEFLGRVDHQIKLRGHRIDPGEIERVLARHDAIRDAVVLPRDDPRLGMRLVAYVVPRRTDAPADELRRHLRERLPEYMIPSAFVELAALPTTPSGKVDRRALAEIAPATPLDASETDGPRTALELELRAVWERVLGFAPIGMHADFFDLGGHSLLAVRLVHDLREQLGYEVPLSALFQAPTIARLALVLERERLAGAWSPLVVLQPDGARAPLFLIHEGGGNVLRLRKLALLLAPTQPVLALQAVGLSGSQPPHERIADMAAAYLREVRRVQPVGPYRIGGASFGGVVAFEMAQQLVGSGAEVALLALFDSSLHPRHMVSRAAWCRFQLSRLALHARHLLLERRRGTYVIDHAHGLRRHVRDWFGARLHDGAAEDGLFVPVSYADVWDAARKAYRDYVPRPYGGRITLFRALTRDPGCPADPAPDWRQWAAGGLEVIDVPGGHTSLLTEPNVPTLANALIRCLERTQPPGDS